ncbi:hypothetical protein CSUI_004227, partial [Cystoisospora suis]
HGGENRRLRGCSRGCRSSGDRLPFPVTLSLHAVQSAGCTSGVVCRVCEAVLFTSLPNIAFRELQPANVAVTRGSVPSFLPFPGCALEHASPRFSAAVLAGFWRFPVLSRVALPGLGCVSSLSLTFLLDGGRPRSRSGKGTHVVVALGDVKATGGVWRTVQAETYSAYQLKGRGRRVNAGSRLMRSLGLGEFKDSLCSGVMNEATGPCSPSVPP